MGVLGFLSKTISFYLGCDRLLPSLLGRSGSSETVAGESQACHFQLHSSRLRPSASSANRKTSHEPAEDCTSGDDSACVVGVHCGIHIASVSWLMIDEGSPSVKAEIKFQKTTILNWNLFSGSLCSGS